MGAFLGTTFSNGSDFVLRNTGIFGRRPCLYGQFLRLQLNCINSERTLIAENNFCFLTVPYSDKCANFTSEKVLFVIFYKTQFNLKGHFDFLTTI